MTYEEYLLEKFDGDEDEVVLHYDDYYLHNEYMLEEHKRKVELLWL